MSTETAAQTAETPGTSEDPAASVEAPETGRAALETPANDSADDAKATASSEAKRYRLKLRETEAERDGLRERVDALERAEVERIAASAGMAVPADLWTITALDELRADGQLDRERVQDHVAEVLRERPTWRERQPDFGAGPRGARRTPAGLSALLGKGGSSAA